MLASLLAALALAGDVRVDVLDVGQGDAIVIRAPEGKVALIDAGDGDTDLTAMLRGLGVDHLDLVVASHPHADHIGGMEAVIRALPPRLYVDSGMPWTTQTYDSLMRQIEDGKVPYRAGRAGQIVNLGDEARLEVLLPGDTLLSGTRSDPNANSVVVRMTHEDDCFLFTGDSEAPTEQLLVQKGIGECDVLKVAHHASDHGSTAGFLAMVKPTIAVVSVGLHNRYHHPGEETLARLKDAGATVYRTDRDGQLTLTSTGHGVVVAAAKAAEGGAGLIEVAALPTPAPPPADAPPADAPPADAPPAVATAARACAYEASRNSEVFHEASCGNVGRIAAQNRVCFVTREEAAAAGLRPAKCCDP